MKILGYVLIALVAVALALYFWLFFNPQSEEQATVNAAWAQFGKDVAALGDVVEAAPFNRDERTAAEGYRHVARLLSTYLANSMDLDDPNYPQFVRFPNSVARIGWDSPDNPYLSFRVRGDHTYRLRGNVRNFHLVTINVYSGVLGKTPVREIRAISGLTSQELNVDEHGGFTLTISADKPADGDWLRLEPDAYTVIVRRIVADWERTDEGLWEVLNLTTLGTGAPQPTPQSITEGIESAVTQVRALRELLNMAHRIAFQLALSPNEMTQPAVGDQELAMADPFQATARGYYKLGADEALLVEVPVVPCHYTNIQLANPWMESLDYASRQTSLNHGNTHIDADNRVRFVVSQSDPGVQNWLDASGYAEGSVFARWTVCDEYPDEIAVRVVKLAELDDHLPEGTARVSAEERQRVIAMRQAAVSRRYAGGS